MFLLLHRNSFTTCWFLLKFLLAFCSKKPSAKSIAKQRKKNSHKITMGNLKDIERITKSCISSLISTSYTHTSKFIYIFVIVPSTSCALWRWHNSAIVRLSFLLFFVSEQKFNVEFHSRLIIIIMLGKVHEKRNSNYEGLVHGDLRPQNSPSKYRLKVHSNSWNPSKHGKVWKQRTNSNMCAFVYRTFSSFGSVRSLINKIHFSAARFLFLPNFFVKKEENQF